MEEVTWWGIPAAGFIVGFVVVLKAIGFPARYAGVLALAIGAVGGLLSFQFGDFEGAKTIALGIMAGLAASGAWSTGKNTAGK